MLFGAVFATQRFGSPRRTCRSPIFPYNPYKAAFYKDNPSVPGVRTFYSPDAADVFIRRTPLLDEKLKWVLTGTKSSG
jgi:hypothetical protein